MLRSYDAIYDHGRVEWLGEAPPHERARVVVIMEEPPLSAAGANGDRLADLIESWDATERAAMVAKFGDPVAWQRESRRERSVPGREDA